MGEPTPGEWEAMEDEDARLDRMEVQSDRGDRIAHVYGDTLDELRANCNLVAASKLLLAYAECSEAQDRYDHEIGFTLDERDAVFVRHGLERPESRWQAMDELARVRAEGLARARPTDADEPAGVNYVESFP